MLIPLLDAQEERRGQYNDWHYLVFPNTEVAVSFIRKNHPEISYMQQAGAETIEELAVPR